MRWGVGLAAAGLGLAAWLVLSMRDDAPQRAAGPAAPIMGDLSAREGLDETVELDGKSTRTLTLDLRK